MKFSLSPKELNNWKARITERLIEYYFEQNLIPKLKQEEGWDTLLVISCPWFTTEGSSFQLEFNEIFQLERLVFLSNGLLPRAELLSNFDELTRTLRNVPDGFLVKLKKTGESKSLKDGMAEMGLRKSLRVSHGNILMKSRFELELEQKHYFKTLNEHGYAIEKFLRFDVEKHDENEQFLVVDGEIEVIEVKAGKGFIPPSQKESYRAILEKGYSLRYFHVDIVSFERNHFEIEEKLIRNPNELEGLRKLSL